MGLKAEEALELDYDGLYDYLRREHSCYMVHDGKLYYLTDVNSHAWRAQDTEVLNDKGHYTDCSELVSTLGEFLGLPFADGKTVEEVFADATFYASYKPEEEATE